jgi:Lantibiotic dehydratase, N terminus
MTQLSDHPSATGAPPPPAPVAESPFVVRVTGLPLTAVTALSSPPLRAALHETLAAEQWLATEGRQLADELRAVIGTSAAPALKPALVGLRRSLHRCRAPRRAEWSPDVRTGLPAGLADRIERWSACRADRDRRTARLAATLAGERDRTARSLLDTAADPLFRHGLAQSSPTLSAELEKWLAHGQGHPARRVLVRLARYISRAATKTSPNTTFALTGTGRWTTGAASPTALAPAPLPPPHGLLELHGTLIAELTAALAADPALRPTMLVRANPSLTPRDGRLIALGPRHREDIVSVAATAGVTRCLAALGDGWQTLGALRARLATPTGTVTGTVTGAVTGADAFLDRLAELGVIELHPPVDDQCPDKFGALARWLRAGGADRAGAAAACAHLSALLRAPTDLTDVSGHRTRLRSVHTAVTALRAAAGLPPEPDRRSAATHEYAVFHRPVATASRTAWQPVLADLDRVRHWMAPHDPGLPLRVALGAYWHTRPGRPGRRAPAPFLHFYATLLADLRHRADDPALADLRRLLTAGPPPHAWRLPALRDLADLRVRSLDALLRAPRDAGGVARPDLGPRAAWPPPLPDHIRPAPSVAWFLQPEHARHHRGGGPDDFRLVLNSAMTGHGRGRARALHLITRSGGTFPPPTAPPPTTTAGAALTADSSGDFGHTLNLRLPTGAHELDYPFTVHRRGHRPRIALRDLLVEPDPATGLLRLRHAPSGAVVTPAHTGMVVDAALPPALQLLTRGLGASPSWLLRPDDLLHPEPTTGEPVSAPRTAVGHIVLRRATWTVPAAALPRRTGGEPDAAWLLRLHRWLADHGIPDRCFVRTNTPAGPDWTRPEAAKARKPLYIDFAAPWPAAVFERLTAHPTGQVAFTEALPAPVPVPVPGGDHLTELLAETTAASP